MDSHSFCVAGEWKLLLLAFLRWAEWRRKTTISIFRKMPLARNVLLNAFAFCFCMSVSSVLGEWKAFFLIISACHKARERHERLMDLLDAAQDKATIREGLYGSENCSNKWSPSAHLAQRETKESFQTLLSLFAELHSRSFLLACHWKRPSSFHYSLFIIID